jgi:hypothetical protein
VPRDIVQFRKFAKHLDGQLTATMVLAEADRDAAFARLPVLERKVGRIRLNGYPTGVEVSHAMVRHYLGFADRAHRNIITGKSERSFNNATNAVDTGHFSESMPRNSSLVTYGPNPIISR